MVEGVAPIIVSALFGAEDFAWVNGLRRQHFPPERNVIDAHLTLFHHLPPSLATELRQRLSAVTRGFPAPQAEVTELMNLGRGVAFRVASPKLAAIRGDLAEAFEGMLTPQDSAGWRPHITVQNKVTPTEARTLLETLSAEFKHRPIRIVGLAAWHYRGGPWEALSKHMFN